MTAQCGVSALLCLSCLHEKTRHSSSITRWAAAPPAGAASSRGSSTTLCTASVTACLRLEAATLEACSTAAKTASSLAAQLERSARTALRGPVLFHMTKPLTRI